MHVLLFNIFGAPGKAWLIHWSVYLTEICKTGAVVGVIWEMFGVVTWRFMSHNFLLCAWVFSWCSWFNAGKIPEGVFGERKLQISIIFSVSTFLCAFSFPPYLAWRTLVKVQIFDFWFSEDLQDSKWKESVKNHKIVVVSICI